MTKNQKYLAIGVAAIALVTTTAIASTLVTRQAMETAAEENKAQMAANPAPRAKQQRQAAAPRQVAQAKPPCDDNNIVGTVGGAVAGGLVGSQFGKGNGRGLATAGGAVAGGALGNAYIPTDGATCN